MTAGDGSPPTNYTSYQQALIEQLLEEAGPGSAHRLVAPVGAGKSSGIAGAVTALVKKGRVSRVLLLSPAALMEQWTYVLSECGQDAIMLNGFSIRAMRNQFVHGMGFPEGVFTMSIDLMMREDVREWVFLLPWDYVVIDEAHRVTNQSREFVRALLERPSPPGLLLSTAEDDVDTYKWAKEIVEIDWRVAVRKLIEEQGYGLKYEDKLVTCNYRRTPEEVDLAHGVTALARQLGPLDGMKLLQQAASSALSLDEFLNSQVAAAGLDTRNLQVLESLLESVEGLSVDSKLDRMRALVGELSQTGIRHSVLFCEYQATLDYLRSAVQDLELADLAIHSGMTVEAREHTFSQFQEDGGFLIATSAASQFLSMSFVEAVIHYDLPLSSRAFSERVGLYLGFGRSIACNTYCLEDETGALPIEAIQLQIARVPDSGSIEMDVDLDALFKRYLG